VTHHLEVPGKYWKPLRVYRNTGTPSWKILEYSVKVFMGVPGSPERSLKILGRL